MHFGLIFIMAWISCAALYGQDTIDQKYLLALLYIRSNTEAQAELKDAFRHHLKKKDRSRCVAFNLNKRISFFGIDFFDYQLKEKNFGIDSSDVANSRLYRKKYGFESYAVSWLDKVLEPSNSHLLLTFSKPVGNYLIAEMLDARFNLGSIKHGPAVVFLFLFEEEGFIEEVLFARPYYN